ncbi:hypothetical protein U27_00444 [Candidatus Vecturithrix granuli]|uniref:Tail specific protease domain-containing protein n=1 Tax=Vecturithrix granuli TaxID=1499967 RepID=A0A081C7J2_VECG1|nr:hypothetical protein U27_00444 [Candidatus Vecturithrix granuli]
MDISEYGLFHHSETAILGCYVFIRFILERCLNILSMQRKQKIHQPRIWILVELFVLIYCLIGNLPSQARELIYSFAQFSCNTSNPYQLDFLYLVKLLQESHPNVYANFPKEDFDQEKERILEELAMREPVSDFALQLQQFCARIGDAHTRINYYNGIQKTQDVFPIIVTVFQDDFYVMNFDADIEMKYVGAKILAVNGMPMTQVMQHLGNLASCENEICRKEEITHYLQEPSTLQFAGIIRDNEPLTLTVTGLDGTEQIMTISTIAKSAVNEVKWANRSMETHPVTARKNVWFQYKILPESQLCYVQLNEFLDRQTLQFSLQEMGTELFRQQFGIDAIALEQYPDFREFLHQMFRDIQHQHIHTLVIDLRHNPGGNSLLGQQLMYYLQDIPGVLKGYVEGLKLSPLMQSQYPKIFDEEKHLYEAHYGKDTLTLPKYIGDMSTYKDVPSPKERIYRRTQFFQKITEHDSKFAMFSMTPPNPRFSGKVFLLIGPGTYSSASWFATEMSDNHLATLVGQPIGQKPTSFGDNLYFRLPHTKVEGTVSHRMFYRPDATKDDDPTLYPDFEVWPTIDDILNGRDPVFDKVLELIAQDKEP